MLHTELASDSLSFWKLAMDACKEMNESGDECGAMDRDSLSSWIEKESSDRNVTLDEAKRDALLDTLIAWNSPQIKKEEPDDGLVREVLQAQCTPCHGSGGAVVNAAAAVNAVVGVNVVAAVNVVAVAFVAVVAHNMFPLSEEEYEDLINDTKDTLYSFS
ncbi:hypothetical protein [Phaeobacter sp. B1627]|uniref:hypothetical protein n=1 Tax=Phaeobacter sp. B1627 TaxID=2583809 RepID=UPI0011196A4D|nr:hypothetical protein [Phaeobacter sp. B1627]TNJ40809.1 hypothetical protein FGE21_16365 [Phaeobacter sp. B1627]